MNLVSWSKNIHPVTWWLVGLLMIACSMLSFDPVLLAVFCLLSIGASAVLSDWKTWQSSMRLYLIIATLVFCTRIAFRIIFNYTGPSTDVAFQLPAIEINLGLGQTVSLFGNVSVEALRSAAVDGLRLAAIVLSVAFANQLANPRKLLKSTPGALYEVATAVTLAINIAPQLITSIGRVRQASLLRGRSKNLGRLNGLIIPVLEDTIESSLNLSASMSARGFGRRGILTRFEINLARSASLCSIAFIAIGVFLSLTAGGFLAFGMLGAGVLLAVVSIRVSSRKRIRTVMQPDTFSLADLLVALPFAALTLSLLFGWWVN